jgi:hypothetical protein
MAGNLPAIEACMRSRFFAPFVSLALVMSAAAQNAPLNSPYAFLVNASFNDVTDNSGAAILGVMNFDGTGAISGTYTFVQAATGDDPGGNLTASLSGTYATKEDGSGTLTLTLPEIDTTLTFATVFTDSGKAMQLMSTDCSSCGGNGPGGGSIVLRGTATVPGLAESLSGTLDISMLFERAAGTIPLTLTATSLGNSNKVYTATGGTSSGDILCDDRKPGSWASSPPVLTISANSNSNPVGTIGGAYLLVLPIKACGYDAPLSRTLSGIVNGTLGAGGVNTQLVLRGSGLFVSGSARATGKASDLNGSYGFAAQTSPVPSGSIGKMSFDGTGNMTATFTNIGTPGNGKQLQVGNANRTGTYTLNPDGTGTITFTTQPPNPSAPPTFAFVLADGGAEILLLRLDGAPGTNVLTGAGRLQ